MLSNSSKRDFIIIVTQNEKLKNCIYDSIGNEYNLIHVNTSNEALSVITLKLPNIFIADVEPESGNGIELAKKLRNGIKTKLTPFILISSQKEKKERLEAIEVGIDDYISFPFDSKELKALVKLRLNRFREFYLLSVTDELTRLYNRKEFISKFKTEITQYPEKKLSVSILDIDFFKKVNDLYGHQTGDIVLMRLAELLKKNTSEKFFPARFGGEEFVILHPSMNMQETKEIMDRILKEFSTIKFKNKETTFNVTFSAGIAEFPVISDNVSELLSRADQALYSAKEEGRNRVYIFNQLMNRNDKFWKYLNSGKCYFINKKGEDVITGLPFLPSALEEIMLSDFQIASIGIIIFQVSFIGNLHTSISRENIQYDIENIVITIRNAYKKGFPSDISIAVSDFFNLEFVVLFPSITDFSAEFEGFNKICFEICHDISNNLKPLNIDIACNSGVVFENKINPHRLYEDINEIRNKTNRITDKNERFKNYLNIFKNKDFSSKFGNYLQIRFFHDLENNRRFQYLRFKEMSENCIFGHFLKMVISNQNEFINFLNYLKNSGIIIDGIPFLLPYFHFTQIDQFIQTVTEILNDREIIILISENEFSEIKNDLLALNDDYRNRVQIGLRDCYIDKNILNSLSIFEFDMVLFSDSILRNIHLFKERINIVNGLKLFLDQIGISSLATGISNEEEYLLLQDLNFKFFSGQYIDSMNTTLNI